MPETRRSNRASAAHATGASEEAEPVRKSLRGLRNEVAAKRAEAKARAQKLVDAKRNVAEQKPGSRAESNAGSETGSSGAVGRRGRKPKPKPEDATAPGAADADVKMVNGEEPVAVKADPEAPPTKEPEPLENGLSTSKMEFILPLSLTAQAGDQYRRTVLFYKKLIDDFTSLKSPPAQMVHEAQAFVQTMRDICMHMDLINDTTTSQGHVEPSQQAWWDRSCSSKFNFMHHLFTNLKTHDIHLAIVAKPGRLLDIVETFVKGCGHAYSRPGKGAAAASSDAESRLSITILESGAEAPLPRLADVVICLDLELDIKNSNLGSLRRDLLAPIISLIVVNSVDHIDRSMSHTWTGVDKLQTEIACIHQLRQSAGKTDAEYQNVEDSATLVADFVVRKARDDDWVIAPLGPLDDNLAWDLAMGNTPLLKAQETGRKRSRSGSVSDAPSPKKARVQSDDASGGQIADSIESESSRPSQEPSEKLRSYKKSEEALKAQLREKENALREREAQIRQIENDFDEQMNRFEAQSFKMRTMERELEDAKQALEDAKQLRLNKEEIIATLKGDSGKLKDELTTARSSLETSTVPEVAELETMRREKEEAVAAKAKAEQSLENERLLQEYLRKEYSTASTSAMELARANADLQSRVDALEKKATGEAVRLKKLTMDNQTKAAFVEITRLEVQLKNVQTVLQRKEEELSKSKRTGIGTRAASVPRSPRVGPTTASRGGSPIPDRRVETLKNSNTYTRGKYKVAAAEDRLSRAAALNHAAQPKEQKFVEARSAEHKAPEPKLPDLKPAQPTQARPVIELKAAPPTCRPFPCCFAQYNCHASFTSKNEWKRHISTKHIQLGFWRCDMCEPSAGVECPVYNDFNRKDLFTQHLRRMHAPYQQAKEEEEFGPLRGSEGTATSATTIAVSSMLQLTEEQILDIQKRCYTILRAPPQQSNCVFCSRVFAGPSSWEERLEHVGGHLERDRKNNLLCLDASAWREDPALLDYLLREGIVDRDSRGAWRIGDGKRRPLPAHAAAHAAAVAAAQVASAGGESPPMTARGTPSKALRTPRTPRSANAPGSGPQPDSKEKLSARQEKLKQEKLERPSRPPRAARGSARQSLQQPTANQDADYESGNSAPPVGKRRRGRPPKRYSEMESALQMVPAMATAQGNGGGESIEGTPRRSSDTREMQATGPVVLEPLLNQKAAQHAVPPPPPAGMMMQMSSAPGPPSQQGPPQGPPGQHQGPPPQGPPQQGPPHGAPSPGGHMHQPVHQHHHQHHHHHIQQQQQQQQHHHHIQQHPQQHPGQQQHPQQHQPQHQQHSQHPSQQHQHHHMPPRLEPYPPPPEPRVIDTAPVRSMHSHTLPHLMPRLGPGQSPPGSSSGNGQQPPHGSMGPGTPPPQQQQPPPHPGQQQGPDRQPPQQTRQQMQQQKQQRQLQQPFQKMVVYSQNPAAAGATQTAGLGPFSQAPMLTPGFSPTRPASVPASGPSSQLGMVGVGIGMSPSSPMQGPPQPGMPPQQQSQQQQMPPLTPTGAHAVAMQHQGGPAQQQGPPTPRQGAPGPGPGHSPAQSMNLGSPIATGHPQLPPQQQQQGQHQQRSPSHHMRDRSGDVDPREMQRMEMHRQMQMQSPTHQTQQQAQGQQGPVSPAPAGAMVHQFQQPPQPQEYQRQHPPVSPGHAAQGAQPQQPQPQQGQQDGPASAGMESDDDKRGARGRSFREVIM